MHKYLIALAIIGGLLAVPAVTFAQGAQSQTPAPAATTKKRQPTPGQIAAHERQKKCANEWKQAKADGKVEKGMKWPQYWSACNKRLKAAT